MLQVDKKKYNVYFTVLKGFSFHVCVVFTKTFRLKIFIITYLPDSKHCLYRIFINYILQIEIHILFITTV